MEKEDDFNLLINSLKTVSQIFEQKLEKETKELEFFINNKDNLINLIKLMKEKDSD